MTLAWTTRLILGAPASGWLRTGPALTRSRRAAKLFGRERRSRVYALSSAQGGERDGSAESAKTLPQDAGKSTDASLSADTAAGCRSGTLSASTAMFGRAAGPEDDEMCLIEECVEYYREPPHAVSRLVDANVEPAIMLQPVAKEYVMVITRPNLPQISELAYPELRLAGYRFHEDTFTPSRAQYASAIHLQRIDDPDQTALPIYGLQDVHRGKRGEQPEMGYPSWSPNGKHVAFCVFTPGYGLELFVMDVETRNARALLPGRKMHAVCGAPFIWNSDSKSLIVKLVEESDQELPKKSPVPKGPLVQEFLGGKPAPSRTFQDLLSSPHDRELFEYYTQCELKRVVLPLSNAEEPEIISLAPSSAVRRASPSPDGKYLLLDTMQKPFEYLTPASRFPRKVVIISSTDGSLVTPVADIPLQDKIPIAFDAVGEGPRNISWRSDAPATLYWVEAQDGGDPAVDAPVRDTVFTLAAPFTATPRRLASMSWRFTGIDWGNEDVALIGERQYKTRSIRRYLICPGTDSDDDASPATSNGAIPAGPCCERACDLRQSEVPKRLIFDRPNWEDRYSDPGIVLMRTNKFGKGVLRLIHRPDRSQKAPSFLMMSAGASDKGNRPRMSLFDPVTKQGTLLWQSTPPKFESIVSLLEVERGTGMPTKVLIRQESAVEHPNFLIYDFAKSSPNALTKIESLQEEEINERARTKLECFIQPVTSYLHPAPELREVKRELVSYERGDGVRLNAVLYLPPGFKEGVDKPLPLLLWAYPREFKNAKFAGQVQDSPYRFVRIARSPLIFLTLGYAILDGPQMPIIGEGDEEPNNTYVEQLVSSAEAAVKYVVDRRIADEKRIAIGGHSYGAFMTANLLIHAPKLFACGIARSGAYNRTLTPFGFQSEERTLWEAGDVYVAMSPYMYANRVEAPLLLVHGEKDNNPGTFPMQSERFYQALKGHGKVSRLVLLPFEEHGYRARESVLHTLYEMSAWLEKYCPPNAAPEEDQEKREE